MGMAEAVYVMCALTSALCAWRLAVGYRRSGVRLLFWSCVCFVGLALNNALLFVDMVVVPRTDMALLRTAPAVLGFAALLFGLVWDDP